MRKHGMMVLNYGQDYISKFSSKHKARLANPHNKWHCKKTAAHWFAWQSNLVCPKFPPHCTVYLKATATSGSGEGGTRGAPAPVK